MGPRVSTVIKKILAADDELGKELDILPEEVAFHYRHAIKQEDRPGRHLSVTYRASRAFDRTDGLLPITVAALFTNSPTSGRPFTTELITSGGGSLPSDVVERWLSQYARVVTHPVIGNLLTHPCAASPASRSSLRQAVLTQNVRVQCILISWMGQHPFPFPCPCLCLMNYGCR
jgi:siderophore synthetase component